MKVILEIPDKPLFCDTCICFCDGAKCKITGKHVGYNSKAPSDCPIRIVGMDEEDGSES